MSRPSLHPAQPTDTPGGALSPTPDDGVAVLVRIAEPEWGQLRTLLFRRYPDAEWATFARFGWRESPDGLVITLAGVDTPELGDLDPDVAHVAIQSQYQRRIAVTAEEHPFAVGVIHSHPEGARTAPSAIDDDMDSFLADLLSGFAPERPYVSLIFAGAGERLSGTGRVWWRGKWHAVTRFACEGTWVNPTDYQAPGLPGMRLRRVARLASAFSEEAAARLAQAVVGVVGASGTGSPVIEALARAGVGRLIVVDPERFVDSNLERVHGSGEADVATEPLKAEIAARHIHAINPDCCVTALCGALPQERVIDALVRADLVIGCTDLQHGRVALSDLALRYLVPAIDCGVGMEGEAGRVDAQVFQVVRFCPADPCVYCQGMVDAQRLAQELMSAEERDTRRAAAAAAEARGEMGGAYWRAVPQIHTVGYLTTLVGALVAGYAIGLLTGRFGMPFVRLQGDLLAPALGTIEVPSSVRLGCTCRMQRGTNDQGRSDAYITAPLHWAAPTLVKYGAARS